MAIGIDQVVAQAIDRHAVSLAAVEDVVQHVQLLDAAFMGALFLHHLEQQRQVQRHGRNGRAGLGDHGLQHRHARIATDLCQLLAQAQHLGVQVLLGGTDRAIPVDGLGDLFAHVGEGGGGAAVGQHTGIGQRIDPHLPVFTAHDRDGAGDFFGGSRLQVGLGQHFLVGIQATQRDRLTDRLQRGADDFAGLRVLAARCSQAVDHLVDLAKIGLDHLDGLGLHLIGEGIAVDAPGVQAGFVGVLVERGRVVPAGRARLGFAARAFEEDAQGCGATAEGSGDARSQAVAGGGADHQHALGAVLDRRTRADVVDLLLDRGFAAGRVGGDADEAADARFDDHGYLGLADAAHGALSRNTGARQRARTAGS